MIYFLLLSFSLGAAFLEAISYFGFVQAHFYLPSYFWHVLVIIYLFIFLPRPSVWLKRLLLFISASALITYLILMVLEFLNYSNFVYTLFHVHLLGLQFFVLLASFHYVFSRFSQNRLIRFGISILVASLIFTASEEIGRSLAFFGKRYAIIFADPLASYEEKVGLQYGGFYPAMQMVKQLTPDNSLILIPPQGNPWEVEGNAPMVTYYLYPRRVENLGETISNVADRPVYALVAHGSWPKMGDTDYGWPKTSIPSTRVWRFDLNTHSYKEFNRAYNPAADQWDWGLIEVKHD